MAQAQGLDLPTLTLVLEAFGLARRWWRWRPRSHGVADIAPGRGMPTGLVDRRQAELPLGCFWRRSRGVGVAARRRRAPTWLRSRRRVPHVSAAGRPWSPQSSRPSIDQSAHRTACGSQRLMWLQALGPLRRMGDRPGITSRKCRTVLDPCRDASRVGGFPPSYDHRAAPQIIERLEPVRRLHDSRPGCTYSRDDTRSPGRVPGPHLRMAQT